MSDTVKVGVRELARQIGRSHVWVLDKIKEGKIPRDSDGRIPLVEALEAVKKLFKENEEESLARYEGYKKLAEKE